MNSLEEFLHYINTHDATDESPFHMKVGTDICLGISLVYMAPEIFSSNQLSTGGHNVRVKSCQCLGIGDGVLYVNQPRFQISLPASIEKQGFG